MPLNDYDSKLNWYHIKMQFNPTWTNRVQVEFDKCKWYSLFVFTANMFLMIANSKT